MFTSSLDKIIGGLYYREQLHIRLMGLHLCVLTHRSQRWLLWDWSYDCGIFT